MDWHDRYFAKVSSPDENGCWMWTATKNDKGYGLFRIKRKMVATHRLAWIIEHGEIPEGKCVLHTCDQPSCVNPGHLFIGTHRDNAIDRDNKGRNKGLGMMRALRTKIDARTARWIRKAYAAGLGNKREIGDYVGLSGVQVGRIVRKVSWRP